MKKAILLPLLCLGLFNCSSGNTPLEPEITHKINFDGGEYLSIDVTECKDQTELFMKISVKDEYLINYEVPRSEAYYEITCNDKEIKNFRILSDEHYDSIYIEIPKEEVIGDIDIKTEGYCHYLTFTAEEDGASIYYVAPEGSNSQIKYCTNLNINDWQDWGSGDTYAISLNLDDTIYVRDAVYPNKPIHFTTGSNLKPKIAASGNIMSLLNFGNLYNGCFKDLFFSSCGSLTSPPILPATTLTDECYMHMFCNCSSLIKAPKLPATTLTSKCYSYMFNGCSSIIEAPELPATTLASECYLHMFNGCPSLKKGGKVLPATTLMPYCYSYMFAICPSLIEPPKIFATTLSNDSCHSMFVKCKSLKVNNIGSGINFFNCPDNIPSLSVYDMFTETGGQYTSEPQPRESYYYTLD